MSKLNIWKNSEFIRSVSTLMTGTVLAQLISYLIYPLITRLYSQEEMGDLGLYLRWVAFIAALATARYELAIPIPKENSAAFQLYRLSLKLTHVILAATFAFFCLYYTFSGWTNSRLLFASMVVLTAYIVVWINAGTSWAVRLKLYKQISSQRVVNSFGVNGFRYIFGLFGWGTFGLLVGTFLGMGLSSLRFIGNYFNVKKVESTIEEVPSLKAIAKEYQVYPKINLPHAIMELGIDLAIAGLIVHFFDKSSFGSFGHAFLMLKLPISIVGQSVGQVFYQRCSEKVNRGESVYPEYMKTASVLFLIGIVPFSILFFYGESIFPIVFGAKWQESGLFAEYMAPYLFINFIISPLSTLVLVLNRQKEAFFIGLFVGIIQLASFGILPLMGKDFEFILAINFYFLTFLLILVFFIYRYFILQSQRNNSTV